MESRSKVVENQVTLNTFTFLPGSVFEAKARVGTANTQDSISVKLETSENIGNISMFPAPSWRLECTS